MEYLLFACKCVDADIVTIPFFSGVDMNIMAMSNLCTLARLVRIPRMRSGDSVLQENSTFHQVSLPPDAQHYTRTITLTHMTVQAFKKV